MKNFLCVFVLTLVAGLSAIVKAQERVKVPRIGVLFPGSPATFEFRTKAFQQGLGELGYLEGKTIEIEWRWAEEKVERLPELAAELVRRNVDVIVANGTPAIKAAKNATQSIPIVMAVVGDPVGLGLVASLARPGGNVTGLTILAPELSGKRLQLLNDAVPKLSRVSLMLNPNNPVVYRTELQETQDAAKLLGLQLQPIVEVTDLNSLREGFATLSRDRAQALFLLTDAIFYSMRGRILEYTAKSRMPVMYWQREFVDEGGLMSYGPFVNELFRRTATYVDKILKGTKPADLPVERPTKFELVVNLKTARALGLTIPQSILRRADELIQ
ncbi:MAG TPA: ABC transporter substrate-binding protein [Candidatus Eisenbacteria bacterium]|nr:ABC transporter substrate-binding protein [Candidatus Eisenbacteria bacterium]